MGEKYTVDTMFTISPEWTLKQSTKEEEIIPVHQIMGTVPQAEDKLHLFCIVIQQISVSTQRTQSTMDDHSLDHCHPLLHD